MKTLTSKLTIISIFIAFASAQISFVPESIDFGPCTVNQTYQLDVVVYSALAQGVTLGGLGEPFSVSENQLAFDNDGDSHTITIYFDPVFPDNYTGAIQAIGLTDFETATLDIDAEGTLVEIIFSEESLDFDEVTIGTNSTKSFDISNEGTGTMLVSEIDSDDDQYTTDFSIFELAYGESITISVTFTPSIAGINNAELSIVSNDPNDNPAIISLTGIGKTDISGNVNGTWFPDNNPYHIVGTTTIADGETLTIEPGVQVIFDGDYNINVNGTLITEGTAQDSIYFISDYNATIEYNNPDTDPNFEYCLFSTSSFPTSDDFESSDVDGMGLFHTNSGSFYSTTNSYEGDYALEMHYNGSNTSYTQRVWTPYYKLNDDSKLFSFALYTDYSSTCNYHFKVYMNVYRHDSYIHTVTEEIFYEDCEDLTWREIEIDYSEYLEEDDEYVQFYFDNNLYDWTTIRIDNLDISGVDPGFLKDAVNLRFTGVDPQAITFQNSTILGSNSHGIYTSGSYKSVTLNSSDIRFSEDQAVHTYDTYSPVTLVDSKLLYNDSYGVYTRVSYSPITVQNSEVSNNGSHGIRPDGSYSAVVIDNSNVNDNEGYGIHTDDAWTPITVTNSEISFNDAYGVYASSSNSQVLLENCIISDNDGYGAYNGSSGDLIVNRSLIARNNGYGLRSNSAPARIDYCTIVDNKDHGFYSNSSYFYEITNSIFWNNDYDNIHRQIYNAGYMSLSYNNIEGVLNPEGTGNSYGMEGNVSTTYIYYGEGLFGSDPQFTSSLYHLSATSPSVDAAHPDDMDTNIPPGLGLVQADQGVYGGPGNDYWGGSPLPEVESAVINSVSDLPQDEGGYVGIQYDGSIYDYAHSGYNISHYSFWRLMDLDGRADVEAFDIPIGPYYNTGREDEYWEHVGDMDAQEHEQYGYSAPTLADSTAAGTFLSTYIVIAHTDDETVFFTSESASGYSVDNLAPLAPQLTSLEIDINGVNLAWDSSVSEDLLYYSVYRNSDSADNEHLADLTEVEFIDSSTPYGSYVEYYITATDEHGNVSEPSETSGTYANVPGDVNQDQALNVIDLILIVDYILDPENSNFDEVQLGIADNNNDGEINIIDVVQLLNLIVDNSGIGREIVEGVDLVKREHSVSHKSEALVGYQMTLSHEAGINITLTENAMIAEKNTLGTLTMVIIVNPKPGVLISSDGDFNIVEIMAASGDKSINVNIIDIPNQFTLKNAYPNPFNPETTIQYGLPDISSVKVSIYDVHGRLVEELVDGVMDAGYHTLIWNGNMVASGVYIVQVQTPMGMHSQKIMLLK